MKIEIHKAFVKNFTETHVDLIMSGIGEIRRFERKFLFEKVSLFRGRNILVKTSICPGTYIITIESVKGSKFKHLWTYLFQNIKNGKVKKQR